MQKTSTERLLDLIVNPNPSKRRRSKKKHPPKVSRQRLRGLRQVRSARIRS